MRILAVTSTFPRWQGDTVPPFVHRLSAGLAAIGHGVHVLAPHTEGAALEEAFDGVTVHRFRYGPSRYERLCYGGGMTENVRRSPGLLSLLPAFLTAEYAAVARVAGRQRFDILHAHWLVPQGLVAAMPKAAHGARLVVSAHGADVFASKGLIKQRLLRFAAHRAAACTVNSTAMQAELERKAGVHATIVPMGVNIEHFARRALPSTDCNRVLFVGRLVEKKGVPYLLEAMARLRRIVPNVNLTIVGDGPDRQALEARAQELGVQDIVRFTGAVPNDALPAYYSSSDLFVAPSIVGRNGDTEGLGVVLLEAAAAGLPIVASNVGGIPDVVTHGKTGLLAAPADSKALADQMLTALTDPALRSRLSKHAVKMVRNRFSWDAVVGQFDDVFHAALAR